MKTITIVSFFLFGFCLTSNAQDNKSFVDYRDPNAFLSKSPEHNFFKLLDKKKLEELNTLEKLCNVELARFKADSGMDETKKIFEMQKLIDQKNNKLSKILSPDEFKIYMSFSPRITMPKNKAISQTKQ